MNYIEWFSFGLLLVLLELFVPGVYLLWFGLSAFVTGVLVIFFPLSPIEQSIVFGTISIFFAVIGLFIYGKVINRGKNSEEYKYLNDMASQYIGKTFVLAEDTHDGRSKATVGDTVWIVECEESLKKGDRVKIIGVINGVILKAIAVR